MIRQLFRRVGLSLARILYVVRLVFSVVGSPTALARRRARAPGPAAGAPTGTALTGTVPTVTVPTGTAPTGTTLTGTTPGATPGPAAQRQRPSVARLVLGVAGVGFALFGAWGILTHQGNSPPLKILPWWIGAIVIHDGVLAPATALAGWLIIRFVPPAARAPIQFAGIVCGLVTIFALPLLYRQGRGFEGSTLLTRDYRANLLGILVAVVAVTVAVSIVRGLTRRRARASAPAAAPDLS